MDRQVECLLQVKGDTVALNTFDKAFRSCSGPQWADRPDGGAPRYSLHALIPVPEDVRNRGYEAAGKLWCPEYWESTDDLHDMQVKRKMGLRCYRFFTPKTAPDNVFRYASYRYPLLYFRLSSIEQDGGLRSYVYHEGLYQGSHSPDGAGRFAAIREEMGFSLPVLFELGQMAATPGVLKTVSKGELFDALDRHKIGDWGDLTPGDKRANDCALKYGDRIFSAYHAENGTKFYIITEADRSATTFLLPDEY